jgi:hypothetical protein
VGENIVSNRSKGVPTSSNRLRRAERGVEDREVVKKV